MRLAALILACAMASDASAQTGQFCVVDPVWGRQCSYPDAPSCQAAAARVRGACVVNGQAPSSGGSDVWGAFNRGVETGEAMGEPRRRSEAPAVTSSATSNAARWADFCERMQATDFEMLEALAPRLTTEEYAAATRAHLNRANYCRSIAR